MKTITIAKRPSTKTIADTVMESGTGGIFIDGARLPSNKKSVWSGSRTRSLPGDHRGEKALGMYAPGRPYYMESHPLGRYPSNVVTSMKVSDLFFKAGDEMSMYEGIPDDLISYLHKMITPTHVGGETLMAMDIGAIEWDTIPDARYHGIIAMGEPTEEQVKHMWRVVKPGAHVLLFAPEDCPTGHRGACTLENNGFEIRDSILWVQDASKIHYVPKASKKERNAGCEAIALSRKGEPMYELRPEVLQDEELIGQLAADLVEGGMSEEQIDSISETGLPKSAIPDAHRALFKRSKELDTYGNFHPTVKPIEIMKRCLKDVPKTARVMDTFMGSGGTAIACMLTGHDFVGIEQDEKYIQIADARVRHWDRNVEGWNQTTIESEAVQIDRIAADMDEGVLDLFAE